MKKVLSIALCLLTLLAVIPFAAPAAQAAQASQKGNYYAADTTSGAFNSDAAPTLAEGNTQLSYADGFVKVNKTLSETGTENLFDVNLEVVTKEQIEQINTSPDAAAVLLIDVSGSMDSGGKIGHAKRAAQTFINSFKSTHSGVQRKVSIVVFSGNDSTDPRERRDGARVQQTWTDASALATANNQTLTSSIQSISAYGGSNLEAGLILAQNILNSDDVKDISNKNIVLLSDGLPTYGVDKNNAAADTTSTSKVCPNGKGMIGTGYSNYYDSLLQPGNPQLHTIHENIVPRMTAIHNANISAYAVYVGNDTFQCKRDCEWAGESAGSWLSGVGFTTFSTTDANKLEEYFQNVSEWIQLKANAWTVTDPMGAMVDFEDFNTSSDIVDEFATADNGRTVKWDLKKSSAGGRYTVRDLSAGEKEYVYTLSYQVKLDTLNPAFKAQDASGNTQYYPTNGVTSLYYVLESATEQLTADYAYFNIPSVNGFTGDISLLKKGSFGELVEGAVFTLTTADDPDFSMQATSTLDENGNLVLEGIPSGHTYTLTETTVPNGYQDNGVTVPITVAWGAATADIISDAIHNESKLLDKLTVTKIWDDDGNRDGVRPSSIRVQLLADGEAYGNPVELSADQIDNDGNWTYTWEGLPAYKNGVLVTYTVEELNVDGYDSSYDQNSLVITNTHEIATVEKTVTKVWDDDGNRDGVRPETISVQLYADGEAYGSPVTLSADMIDNSGNWTYTWNDLPANSNGQPIQYTVQETEVDPNYTSTVNGMTITNKHEVETVDKTVTKIWDDDDNRDGIRPDRILVVLFANGDQVSEPVELRAETGWSHTWEGLFANDNGEPIEYTVQEMEVPLPYVVSIDGFNITNSYESATTAKTITKVWDDNNDQDRIRPESVAVQLYANGNAVGEAVSLSAQSDWSYTWENLPVNEKGKAIEYTVEEVDVPEGYEASFSAETFTLTNTHKPGTVAKTVAKVWDDNNNADKKRPNSIQVQLYANGDAVGDPVVLNADGDWKYTWANLDAKKDGQEVSYSVKELEVPKNYKASYSEDGFTITNKLQKDPIKPVTGDTMHLGLWLIGFVVAASALCVGILLKKKTSRKAARHS